MLNTEFDYEIILKQLIQNIILYISDIAKILGENLSNFTEPVGFSVSSVSRIRRKLKNSPETYLENLSYALCLFTALDSKYLFEYIDTNSRKKIEKLLFKNSCQNIVIFLDEENNPVTTTDLNAQPWFKLNYQEGKGFVYQVQFLLHEINTIQKYKYMKSLEKNLLTILKSAKIAFTVTGLKIFESQFEDIITSLQEVYKKDFSKDCIYASNVIKNEIYYDNISQHILSRIKTCPVDKKISQYPDHIPDYIKDFIEIINFCDIENSNLILFIRDEEDMIKYSSFLDESYNDKIIFAFNKYFKDKNCYKIIFHYKNEFWFMNLNTTLSKYEYLLNR